MDVKAFKLRSGEEVISEVTETKKAGKHMRYTIENPIAPSANGLSPWFPFSADRKFELQDSDLFFPPSEPHPEILELYNQQFGTILTPPNTNKIVSIKK
jgi:hypothetical protein